MTKQIMEQEFDLWLKENVPERLPDSMAESITPWKKAMGRIWLGFAMTTLLLDLLGLDVILPAVGYLLSFWGFRAVYEENRWLRLAGWITAARGVFFLARLLLPVELFQEMLQNQPLLLAVAAVAWLSVFPFLFCLWRGYLQIQKKAGLPPRVKAIPALMVWYLLVYFLRMLAGYLGLLLPIGLFVLYLLAMDGVRRAAGELENAGYAVKTRAPKVSPYRSGICILGLFLAAWAGRYLLF